MAWQIFLNKGTSTNTYLHAQSNTIGFLQESWSLHFFILLDFLQTTTKQTIINISTAATQAAAARKMVDVRKERKVGWSDGGRGVVVIRMVVV